MGPSLRAASGVRAVESAGKCWGRWGGGGGWWRGVVGWVQGAGEEGNRSALGYTRYIEYMDVFGVFSNIWGLYKFT